MNIPSRLYNYDLPKEHIADRPALQRDRAKMLVFKNGSVSHHRFHHIPDLLPPDSTLFFNNTRVMPARLTFIKETGGKIEILLLTPVDMERPTQDVLEDSRSSQWECAIRNSKRWKCNTSLTLSKRALTLTATLLDKNTGKIEFSWNPPALKFSYMLNIMGSDPIPPYLHRPADEADKKRYQTVYSTHPGSVAAPTAGLHFSESLIEKIQSKKIITQSLTLHIGGGTFHPIKTENAADHIMHAEQLLITEEILDAIMLPHRQIMAVGTTSMRTLESIYWFGVQLLAGKENACTLTQTTPYRHNTNDLPSRGEALQAVKKLIKPNQSLIGKTSLYILPGYQFKICDGLITNFHMPKSSLLLLVAAFIGGDWKSIYQIALDKKYRFLSYGDSSLLLPNNDHRII